MVLAFIYVEPVTLFSAVKTTFDFSSANSNKNTIHCQETYRQKPCATELLRFLHFLAISSFHILQSPQNNTMYGFTYMAKCRRSGFSWHLLARRRQKSFHWAPPRQQWKSVRPILSVCGRCLSRSPPCTSTTFTDIFLFSHITAMFANTLFNKEDYS